MDDVNSDDETRTLPVVYAENCVIFYDNGNRNIFAKRFRVKKPSTVLLRIAADCASVPNSKIVHQFVGWGWFNGISTDIHKLMSNKVLFSDLFYVCVKFSSTRRSISFL